MIRFNPVFSSEHTEIPDYLKDKSEKNIVFCTYAWIFSDEIGEEEFPIAVLDYKPQKSKRIQFIFSDPIWHFISEERTKEQQEFIDKNLDKLNELWIECAHNSGYLENVK